MVVLAAGKAALAVIDTKIGALLVALAAGKAALAVIDVRTGALLAAEVRVVEAVRADAPALALRVALGQALAKDNLVVVPAAGKAALAVINTRIGALLAGKVHGKGLAVLARAAVEKGAALTAGLVPLDLGEATAGLVPLDLGEATAGLGEADVRAGAAAEADVNETGQIKCLKVFKRALRKDMRILSSARYFCTVEQLSPIQMPARSATDSMQAQRPPHVSG